MDFWSTLLAIVAVLLALYYYSSRNSDYFEKRGIPYIKPLSLVNYIRMAFVWPASLAESMQYMYNVDDTAKYIGLFEFRSPVVVLRDPELIKSVWIKNFDHFIEHRTIVDEGVDPLFAKNLFFLSGERWKEVRNLLTPAFTTSKLKSMFALMSECGAEFARSLPPAAEVDMKDAFARFTSDAIASCAFGFSVNSVKDRDNLFFKYGKEAANFGPALIRNGILSRLIPGYNRVCSRLIRKELADYFVRLVEDVVKTREEKGIVRADMIQLMMESKERMSLSYEDITAQSLVFIFGGFDTASTVMSFAAHEIAVNPEVQERLQREIDDVSGELTYEAVNDMPYLAAVVNETFRMYPAVVMVDRKCTKAFELPATKPGAEPLTLQPGSVVYAPIYGLHHDPQYFPEPKKFNPERFIENGKELASSGAFAPFGMGPRMCTGNRFAILEIKAALFHLLARFDLRPCAKTSVPMRLSKEHTANIMAEDGFWLEVRPRSNPRPSVAPTVASK